MWMVRPPCVVWKMCDAGRGIGDSEVSAQRAVVFVSA